MHHGEHRRVHADSERKRERRNDRERRRAPERAGREAEILAQSLEPDAAPHLARDFLHVSHVAELASRRGLSVAARFAARHAIAHGHLEVGPNLVVEVEVALRASPQKPKDAHRSAVAGRITPAIAVERSSHFDRSTASCLRPAAVSL